MTFDDIMPLIAGSLLVALVAAGIAVAVIVVRYKKKLKAPIYPVDKYATLSVNGADDRFIGSTVTRVRVSSSKSDKR